MCSFRVSMARPQGTQLPSERMSHLTFNSVLSELRAHDTQHQDAASQVTCVWAGGAAGTRSATHKVTPYLSSLRVESSRVWTSRAGAEPEQSLPSRVGAEPRAGRAEASRAEPETGAPNPNLPYALCPCIGMARAWPVLSPGVEPLEGRG